MNHIKEEEKEKEEQKRPLNDDDAERSRIKKVKNKHADGEDGVTGTNEPICLICLDVLGTEGLTSFPCRQHIYHRPCVLKYVKHCLASRLCPVPCPARPFDGSHLTSIQADGLIPKESDQTLYDRIIEDNRVAHDPFLHYCPTPGCRTVLTTQLEVLKAAEARKGHTGVICSQCRKEFILGKRSPEDEALEILVLKEGFKACPQCGTYIKGVGGCKKITCVCKCQFCFECLRLRAANCRCERTYHEWPEQALTPHHTMESTYADIIKQSQLEGKRTVRRKRKIEADED